MGERIIWVLPLHQCVCSSSSSQAARAAARSGDTGPSTHFAISTNMVDIDISVDNSMDGALEPIKTTMDQETKVLTTDF